MKYRFYGDTLKLVKYEIEWTHAIDTEEHTETFTAISDAERDELLERYPEATVTPIDNTGYEWLDGMTFTQEQLKNGELEKTIALGEDGYAEYKAATNQDAINAMLLLKIAELTAEVKGNE